MPRSFTPIECKADKRYTVSGQPTTLLAIAEETMSFLATATRALLAGIATRANDTLRLEVTTPSPSQTRMAMPNSSANRDQKAASLFSALHSAKLGNRSNTLKHPQYSSSTHRTSIVTFSTFLASTRQPETFRRRTLAGEALETTASSSTPKMVQA